MAKAKRLISHQYDSRYLQTNGKKLQRCADYLIDLLRYKTRRFYSIVMTGSSGTLVGGIVAAALGKPVMVTSKPHGKGRHTQGVIGQRYIVIDDFISSGNTVNHILKEVDSLRLPFEPCCVGIYLYGVAISTFKHVYRGIPINGIFRPSQIPNWRKDFSGR